MERGAGVRKEFSDLGSKAMTLFHSNVIIIKYDKHMTNDTCILDTGSVHSPSDGMTEGSIAL